MTSLQKQEPVQIDRGNDRPIRVVLAGNPNAGKTSLFYCLVGSHQHVGNCSGVTVEKRSGRCRFDDAYGQRHRAVAGVLRGRRPDPSGTVERLPQKAV